MRVLLLAVAPAVSVVRWMRLTRRRKSGLCHSCGYDLRATPGEVPRMRYDRPGPTRTMKRRLLNLLTLLLWVAVVGLWVRS